MRWIFLELFRFSRIFCFLVIYFCCHTFASSVDHILHNIGEEARLELSDLQSQNVKVTFEGDQWIAVLTCKFQYESIADVSWHSGKTGNRTDPDAPTDKMVVTNIMSEGTIESTLTIYNFGYEDVGQYTCLLAEPKGYTNQTLWVAPKPIVDYDGLGFVVEEENVNVTIPCTSFPGAQLFFRFPCKDNPFNSYLNLEIKNVTEVGDVNQTIAFSFTPNVLNGSEYFLCCMNMQSYQQQQQCTMFPIYIKGGPVRFDPPSTYCSTVAKTCTFGGVFTAYPFLNESDINWRDEDGDDVTNRSSIHANGFAIYSFIKVPLVETYNYTLTATGENETENNYMFSTAANQFGPLLMSTPVVTLTDNQGTFSAKFSCLFTASPPATIHWHKLPFNGYTPNILTEILNSTSEGVISTVTFPSTNQTLTVLEILPYVNRDEDVFICVAVNQNGIMSSKPLSAFKRIGDFQLNINGTSVLESNAIVAECSAKGYPPPNIFWKITAEFDIVYNIVNLPNYDTGETMSTATIMDLGDNSFVDVECIAFVQFDQTQNMTASRRIDINHITTVSRFVPCTPDQFTGEAKCNMTCDFQSDNALAMSFWDWIYYVTDPIGETNKTMFALLDEGKSYQLLTPYRTQVSLSMINYNAGWYRCLAVYQNTSDLSSGEVVYHDYRIFQATGVNIGDTCQESHECISLYAVCVNNTCQCTEPRRIPYDDKPNTLKCLGSVGPNHPCVNDAQCEAGMPNYVCRRTATDENAVCTCNGHEINVEVEGQEMCLHQADYGDTCKYNEECELADINMRCSDKCTCANDYTYDDFLKFCVTDAEGSMSTTSIVVVVLAVFLASALAVAIIGGIMKNRRHQPSRNAMHSGLSMTTRNQTSADDSNGELPYAQFSDLTLEVDGASTHSENA